TSPIFARYHAFARHQRIFEVGRKLRVLRSGLVPTAAAHGLELSRRMSPTSPANVAVVLSPYGRLRQDQDFCEGGDPDSTARRMQGGGDQKWPRSFDPRPAILRK